jgi:hypothetical protein
LRYLLEHQAIAEFNVVGNYIEGNHKGAIHGSTTYNAASGAAKYVFRLIIRDNYINERTTDDGVTAAVTLTNTNGVGGWDGSLSSFDGAIIGPNYYTTGEPGIAWLDLRNRNGGVVTLVSPMPHKTGAGTGFGSKFIGVGRATVAQGQRAFGTGAPAGSADYLGQEYEQTSPGVWWRAKSVGRGPDDWDAMAVRPTVSSDRGDSSQTLTVGIDAHTQRWATRLTGNRTITLSKVGASNGDGFRIVRTGLGGFTLDVGGLKTLPANTAGWVEVQFDGRAWVLVGHGEL